MTDIHSFSDNIFCFTSVWSSLIQSETVFTLASRWIPLGKQSKAMQCFEGVNDLLSAPAADVGGMEVNGDEVFSIEPWLTWRTRLMFPSMC